MGLFGKSDKEKEREDIERANEARRKMQEAQRKKAATAAPAPPAAKPAGAPAAARPAAVPVSAPASAGDFETYMVVKGDSLSKIAKRHLGNANDWPQIYDANRATIGDNPDKIFPGQQLRIPRRTGANA